MRDCSRLTALLDVMESAQLANQLKPRSRIQGVTVCSSQHCHNLCSGITMYVMTDLTLQYEQL